MTKTSDDAFRRQLLETFREEALEYLADIADGLIILEKDEVNNRPDIVESIYRKTHSLKGASRAVNIPEIVSICQNLENIFSAMLKGEFTPDDGVYDLFYRALKSIRSELLKSEEDRTHSPVIVAELKVLLNINKAQSGNDGSIKDVREKKEKGEIFFLPETESFPDNNNEIIEEKDDYFYGPPDYNKSLKSSNAPDFSELGKKTVRIASEKLDRLIRGSDDLLTIRLFFSQRIKELESMVSGFEKWRWNDGQIFNEVYKLQEVYHSYDFPELPTEFERSFDQIRSFLDYNREFVTNLEHHLSRHIRAAEIDRSDLQVSTSEISDLIHDAVLLPFNSMIMSFPEYTREISKSLGKEVTLEVEGGNIEMDRRILESLRDPMRHLIRNSIDHGIEEPKERISAGKPPGGEIRIKVYTLSGSRVGIKIIDDGAGIDGNAVKRKAVEKGIITEKKADQITEDEAIGLIFRSGLTTSQMITEISGRGLGLAIVADAISHLSGDIELKTIHGKGTEFTIILPLKIVTFRGVVVISCEHQYVFPKQQVKKVISIESDVLDPGLSQQTIMIADEKIGVMRLSEALGIKNYNDQRFDTSSKVPVVIIAYGVGQIGFIVDEIVRVQEIVVRSLGTQLRQVKKISGAAVLGDGTTALVLAPLELIEEALKPVKKIMRKTGIQSSSEKILIVEDSITSRQYILNILKKRGFNAETAGDGAEAILKLKESEFSLVVTDVDMPRMSGFTLTEKIKGDNRLSKIPVILVTSLDSPADKKQGIISGADAYITKKSFSEDDFIIIVKNLLR